MDPFSIFNQTIKNGGATLDAPSLLDLDAREGEARYAVGGARGISERGFDLDNPGTPQGVELHVRRVASVEGVSAVGTWHDQENHQIVVDAVSVFRDLDKALRVARRRGEVAIFDLVDGEEITV